MRKLVFSALIAITIFSIVLPGCKYIENMASSAATTQNVTTDTCFNYCLIPSSRNPDSILANMSIRQAVEHAIDKQALVDKLTNDYGHVSNQVFIDILPEYDSSTKGYEYSLQKASDLLKRAGFDAGIHTQILVPDFLSQDLPLAIKDMVKKVGIEIDVTPISSQNLADMIDKGGSGWDGYIFSYSLTGTAIDPATTLLNGPLNGNTTWISCEEPDDLLTMAAKGTGELDAGKRSAIYREISRMMTDSYCMWTFLYWSPEPAAASPKLKGHTIGQYHESCPHAFAWLES